MIYAARHGRTEIVRMLVDHPNIDIFATDMVSCLFPSFESYTYVLKRYKFQHGKNALDASSDTTIQMLLRKNGIYL